MYRNRIFDTDVIEWGIRWHITYQLSDRGLVEMRVERAIKVAQKTVDYKRRRDRGIAAAQAFFCKGQFWVGRRR